MLATFSQYSPLIIRKKLHYYCVFFFTLENEFLTLTKAELQNEALRLFESIPRESFCSNLVITC